MKKKILFSIFLFLSVVKIFACKCDSFGSIGENYSASDVIGEITVTKIYGNDLKNRTYKADISFDKIYKGQEVKSVVVSGVLGDIQSPACEFQIKVGEKYLIYLTKYDQEFQISACTPKFLIGNKNQNFEYSSINLQQKALEFLSKNPQTLEFVFYFDDSVRRDSRSDLSKLDDKIKPDNQFAIYKLKVNEHSRIEEIFSVSEFGKIDEQIHLLMKKNFAVVKGFMEEIRNKEVLLLMFFVPENKGKEYKEIITNNLDE